MDEAASSEAPNQAPSGERCALHSDIEAVATCPRCGRLVCGECWGQAGEELGTCEACELPFELPWEDAERRRSELLVTWWQSVRRLLGQPGAAVVGVERGRSETALGFGMLTYSVGMAFYLPLSAALKWMSSDPGDPTRLIALGLALGTMFTLPFWAAVGLLVNSAFLWLFMRGVGGQGSYRATVRGLSYSTAPMVFYLVPVLGWLVGSGWQLVLMVFALGRVHEISRSRVLLGLLLPLALLAFLLVGAALLVHFLAAGP